MGCNHFVRTPLPKKGIRIELTSTAEYSEPRPFRFNIVSRDAAATASSSWVSPARIFLKSRNSNRHFRRIAILRAAVANVGNVSNVPEHRRVGVERCQPTRQSPIGTSDLKFQISDFRFPVAAKAVNEVKR
jgi:hypothetical protein